MGWEHSKREGEQERDGIQKKRTWKTRVGGGGRGTQNGEI